MPSSKFVFGNITWYGLIIGISIIVAIFVGISEEKRKLLPKDSFIDFCLIAIPISILGARAYYIIFNLNYYLHNPKELFQIWNGGLAIYGAIIAGAIALIIYSKYKNVSITKMLDIVAPSLIIAQAIGRWGNYFNIEAYGRQVFNISYQKFPLAIKVINNGVQTWHMATFFYESIWNFIGFLIIWRTRKLLKNDGDSFLSYLLIYGVGRAFIEGLRADSLYLGSIRISQLISVLMCLSVIIILLYKLYNKPNIYFSIAVLYLIGFLKLTSQYFIPISILILLVSTICLIKNKCAVLFGFLYVLVLSFSILLMRINSRIIYQEVALLLFLTSILLLAFNMYQVIYYRKEE